MKTVQTLLLVVLPVAVAQAQFRFTNNNEAITITGFACSSGTVPIPAATNGLPVTSIGFAAFSSCDLTDVSIPDSVTNIGGMAFYYCVDLTSVSLPAANIDNEAFQGCFALTNVMIGNSVDSGFFTSIGADAFVACSSLTNVTIGNSVTNINAEGLAFGFCHRLVSFTVDARNPAYSSLAGVLFNKSRTTLLQYPEGIFGSYTIPASVTNIGGSAFLDDVNLTSVTIPKGVTSIGAEAFEGCSGLASVFFMGNAPTSVGSGAFSTYSNTTAYYLPNTTGWSSFATNSGIPVAPWLPQILANGGRFGVQTNQFGFNVTWASNQVVIVEACTNLANPVWQPLQTNTLTGSPSYFSDSQWTNSLGRFYRLHAP